MHGGYIPQPQVGVHPHQPAVQPAPHTPCAAVLLLPGERPAHLPYLVHRYRTNRVPQSIAPMPRRPASTEQDCMTSAGRVKLRGGWLDGLTLSPFPSAARFWGLAITALLGAGADPHQQE